MKFLGHFSRITTPGRAFIPQIDGLRFIAIMSVVAYHVRQICSWYLPASPDGTAVEGDPVNDIFAVGHYGVCLFFAISGFILSLPFARQYLRGEKKVSLKQYYIRRVTRIEPPYVIHLVFLFALCALVLRHNPTHPIYHNPAWVGYTLKHILASLIYSHCFIYGTQPYPNYVLWSLETEVQFYLLAPVLARVFMIPSGRLRRVLLFGFIFLFPFAGIFLAHLCHNPDRILFSLIGNAQYFLAGFLLADIYLTGRLTTLPRNWWWDLLLLAAFAVVVCFRHTSWLFTALPGLILICCLAAFRGLLAFRFLGNPWITTIGGMCYTIYMYHALIISTFVRITWRWQLHVLWADLLIQFVLMSVFIIFISAILFSLCERPFMQKNWPEAWQKTIQKRFQQGKSLLLARGKP